jgi:hypothetical protein
LLGSSSPTSQAASRMRSPRADSSPSMRLP